MKKNAYGHVSKCQICGNDNLKGILDLGHQPIVQNYRTQKELHEEETTYPLNLVRCEKCGLVQLDYVVDPKLVFPPHYPYRTGLTNMLIRNFESLAETLKANGSYADGDLIVDIGSNDGTLLSSFKRRGMKVVGVEPTRAARVANKNGIKTYEEFFTLASAKKVVAKHGKAKVITATNVFAHIDDTPKLIRAVKAMMGKDSVFVSESQYLADIVEKLEFDTVYHEHLRFYALKPLMRLAKDAGMSIVDAERIDAAGGSIRVYMKTGTHKPAARVAEILKEEEALGLYDTKTLRAFGERVISAKNDLLALLLSVKKTGATIAGVSSAARSNTLLGFTKINTHLVSYAGEKKGSPKIGLFTPGTHIPVVDEEQIFKEQPSYALILSWHIGEELMRIYRKLGYKGKFIMPLPTPRIIDN
jgi:2-polyprenyl-3-methyl-5-hydroxy-6-metoxy-1,4-benzoquinol methylase